MSFKRILFLVLAILGFALPWYYNIQFFGTGTIADFISQSSDNLASKSLSFDLFIASITGFSWMVIESRRVGVKFVWLYILLGFFVAFAFAFPLFLYARETALEKAAGQPPEKE
ncbi:DUF2834 domain-containing protein [Pannus brasiliensis CCIBt3594]|uniref:DUF2834 domain-containing protein n=1 Tax=Pannus brasiliensis CCIBt3594 TaxID=1427578 RepID=A0AAW9QU13_9CHRO